MSYKSVSFDISENIIDLGLNGAYLAIGEINNKISDPKFDKLRQEILAEIKEDVSPTFIDEDKILQGFRLLHESIKVSNRKNVSSPENLILNYINKGYFPHVNLLVDIYNLVSIQTRLALGAHDLDKVTGNIHLKLTTGSEGFLPLGLNEQKPVRPDCYSYIDDANDIICWLEVRQVEKTKVTLESKDCFYIIQGNAHTNNDYIKAATERLIELTNEFCGGEVKYLYKPWN